MQRLFSSSDNLERDLGLVSMCLLAFGWPTAGLAIGNKLNMISSILGLLTLFGSYGPWIVLNIVGAIVAVALIYIAAQPKNIYLLRLLFITGFLSIVSGLYFQYVSVTLSVVWFSVLFTFQGVLFVLLSCFISIRNKGKANV